MAQSNFFQPGFDEQIESQNIERQRKYAELLRQQADQAPQSQMVSGRYVAPSITQGLANMLKSYQSGQGMREADEKQKALAEAITGRRTEEMAEFGKRLAEPNGMDAAYQYAASAKTPGLQQAGLKGLAEMPEIKAKAAQRMDEMKAQHALRMEQMAAQNASREEMMRQQQAFQMDMRKLQASQSANAQPYFQPVQTANGVMAFNARTGRVEAVMAPDGRPIVGAAADPALQGAIAGAKSGATTEAKARTEARLEAPQAIAQGEEAIKLVDDLLKAPGFKQAVGGSRLLGIQKIPGTDAKDFDVRLDQLKGKQFLQAFESLKGGGQITEVEGKKATDAIARMDAASSEKEFTAAAKEFQGVIRQGIQRAKTKGGVNPVNPTAPAAAPAQMPAGFKVIR